MVVLQIGVYIYTLYAFVRFLLILLLFLNFNLSLAYLPLKHDVFYEWVLCLPGLFRSSETYGTGVEENCSRGS